MIQMLHKKFLPVLSTFVIGLAFCMCVSCEPPQSREIVSPRELWHKRDAADAAREADARKLMDMLVTRAKAKEQASPAGPSTQPTTVDLLVISGGGDWGAFGAGVLKGWGRVKGDLARPQFDAVTGVSTGALIAPFAFLGDDASIEKIVQLYRNPREDWAKSRGLIFFWPTNPSFYSLPGLEHDADQVIDLPMLKRIADQRADNRSQVVNTTNVDLGDSHPWDIVVASQQAVAKNDPQIVRQILFASAGIPGIFPARDLGDSLYVDGAVTGNILYGGRIGESNSFWERWRQFYPNDPIPRVRYWVIFNNQFRFPPEIIQEKWPDILARASIMATQSATLESIRRLYAIAEIAHLKRGADVQVRVMAVPDDWLPPKPGVFQKEVMNNLADLGEHLGADPANWSTSSP